MFKKRTLSQKIFILIFIIFLTSVIGFATLSIEYAKRSGVDKIDDLILSVVYGTQKIVGDDYHDKIEDSTSIKPEDYLKIVNELSEFAKNVKVKYVYTYINYKGELRFTSSSFTDEEILKDSLKIGEINSFFLRYNDDPEIIRSIYFKPFRDGKPEFFKLRTSGGYVRSVFIPFTTAKGKQYFVGVDYSYDSIKKLETEIIIVYSIFGLVILIIANSLAYFIIKQIAKPLTELITFTNELVKTDFQLSEESQSHLKEISIKSTGGVGLFYRAFFTMQVSLQKYLTDLRNTTTVKEKMESQLRIAKAIQTGMIPKGYPHSGARTDFDIRGAMYPAKEVGGDLYNYFMIDDEHLGFTIGDVSDKGIAAALFMAMTNTLLKAIALSGLNPADVLYKVNNELFKDNNQCMFVTLFFGILNIKTGEVEYANAGHNPYILILNGGSAEYKKISAGMVLAAFEDVQYCNERIVLKQNDTIFMYTDGITEAMNIDRKLYGEGRLLEIIKKSWNLELPELINVITNSVSGFVNGYEQSDDITLLILRFLSANGDHCG